jgi:hypothetical protein
MCPFCDHRNPADAKFCNECASPLNLKPCSQCNRVNEQAATRCYECGTAFPSLSRAPDAKPMSPSADLAAARATSSAAGTASDTASTTRSPLAAPVLRAYRDLRRPALLIVSIAAILIVGAYATRHIDAQAPDATEVIAETARAAESDAPSAPSTVAAPERGPMKAETASVVQPPSPAVVPEAQARGSVPHDPALVPVERRASAHQHPAPVRGTAVSAARRKAHRPVAANAGVPVAEISKTAGAERWQAMYTSLARCGGDLSARIVCDERVRRQFCEGHWKSAPACANGVLTDRGQ